MELLLEGGASLAETDYDGRNALELALHHRRRPVVETILASKEWRLAMRATTVARTDRGEPIPDTPLREDANNVKKV